MHTDHRVQVQQDGLDRLIYFRQARSQKMKPEYVEMQIWMPINTGWYCSRAM